MKNRLSLAFVGTAVAILCGGCGFGALDLGKVSGGAPTTTTTTTNTKSFKYEYEYNACNTGEHTFSSLDELCSALQSDSVNNDCALSLRKEGFKAWSCSGSFNQRS
ncbi:MAG: hypothetical protein HYR96_05965 [Deltaproteobacteria bacterium]|nr:hypothetical protein [Deltaproteobacteria bacterium]MBI3296104.1 hypothetical protein [Deltaproteobacteria bacterium]